MSDIKLTSTTFRAVPNQKAFRVFKKRAQEESTDVRVSDLYKKDLLLASRELKDTTFKLYMYLVSNQEGYTGGLSKADAITQTGISESSYKRAIKELEEKGYLVYMKKHVSDMSGALLPLYNFYARPL